MSRKAAALAAVPEGASDQDMLAAQKTAQEGVVTAAKAVVLGLEEGDAPHSEVVAAKMDLADAEAAVAVTQMAIDDAATLAAKSAPLVLVDAAAVQTALKSVNTKLTKPAGLTPPSTTPEQWVAQDPTSAGFALMHTPALPDPPVAMPPLFRVKVADQKITVTAMGAVVETNVIPTDTILDLPAFAASTTNDAPSVGAGWMDNVHEREYKRAGGGTLTGADDVVVMDMVTTYTNQDPAGDEYYAKYYSDTAGRPEIGESGGSPDVADPDGAVILANDRSKLAESSGFPSGESQTYTFDGGAGNKPELAGDDVLLGKFNGVSGKFSCMDASCVATTDAKELLSLDSGIAGGAWVFTPDGNPEKIVVEGVIADVDYLTFGYWVETTTDNVNGKTTYRIGVSHTPTHTTDPLRTDNDIDLDDPATDAAEGVSGTATYAGPAGGMFARRAYDPESGGDVETAGRFTAKASLTADFDRADLSIDGMITDFMHGGSEIDPEWSVVMSEGVITATTGAIPGGTFASDSVKQGLGDGSVWSGTFNGHHDMNQPNTPVNELTLKPTGATGMFSDIFDNGAVLGAFGVEKEE